MIVIDARGLTLHQLGCDARQRRMLEYLLIRCDTLPVAKILEETTGIIGCAGDRSEFARLRKVLFNAARQRLKLG